MRLPVFFYILWCICLTGPIRAQTVLKHTLQSPEPLTFEFFGSGVSIDRNRILVGAPDDTSFEGKAFLFDADTGSLLHTFSHPTPKEGNFFGGYVGLGDGFAAVMAEVTSEEYSEVFIFDLETRELERTIRFPTFVSSAIGNYKGNSLAVIGKHVLIGASDNEFGRDSFGTAFLYDATTGNLLNTFVDPNPQRKDYFGSAVALSEDYMAIAARGDDTDTTDAGHVFIFDRATGNFLHSIGDPTPTSNEYFGWSLALEGNILAVGQPGRLNLSGTEPGETFLFDVATGSLIATLLPPTGIGKAFFGQSVAMDGGLLGMAQK